MRLASIVLPEPVPPMMPMVWPRFAVKSMSESVGTSAPGQRNETWWNETASSVSTGCGMASGAERDGSCSSSWPMRLPLAIERVMFRIRLANLMSSTKICDM